MFQRFVAVCLHKVRSTTMYGGGWLQTIQRFLRQSPQSSHPTEHSEISKKNSEKKKSNIQKSPKKSLRIHLSCSYLQRNPMMVFHDECAYSSASRLQSRAHGSPHGSPREARHDMAISETESSFGGTHHI